MATRRTLPPQPRKHANLSPAAIPEAIRKLRRCLDKIKDIQPEFIDEIKPLATVIVDNVNTTLADIFGKDTVDYVYSEVLIGSFIN
jgi:hypothetical protein